jgi:hypothetical protein
MSPVALAIGVPFQFDSAAETTNTTLCIVPSSVSFFHKTREAEILEDDGHPHFVLRV